MVVVSMPRLYDSVAAQSWSRQFGSSEFGSNPDVAVDAVGNVYVVGSTYTDVLEGIFSSDVYVQKFDALGNEIASIQFGTSDDSAAASVAVDAAGNVYVAGATRGAFAGNTSQGGVDGFVAKFNSSLVLQGTVQFGTSEDDSVYSAVVDAVGNVYVAGWTQGAFAGYANPGLIDGFVAKFNSSLVLQGTVQFGTSEDDLAYSVAVDAAGNVYVAGWTDGAFAGYTNPGGDDGFVAKFNSSLVLQGTVKQFGTSEDDEAYSIAVDAAGNVYVAGRTEGAFAGNENQGGVDAFVAKFNSSLVLQDTVQFGTLGFDVATSMAVDAAGNVYVVGAIDGPSVDDMFERNFEAFVARFNSSLVLQGTVKQFGTSELDAAYSVAVDAAGNVYVAGDTTGDLFGPNSGSYDTFVLKEVA
jgi:ethanolamine utilization microcompartment shell protein EutS